MNMKCPNCGGPLVYDVETDSMKCEHCSKRSDKSVTSQFTKAFLSRRESMEVRIYHCSSCGADLMVGDTQASTFCSYCGAPSIVYDRVSKEEKPDKIIPFKLTERQALACIQDRFGYGSYIPPQIRKLTPEKIHAIYIPYWLFTSHIQENAVIKVRTDNGYYTCYKNAECTYHNMPFDAAFRLNNDLASRLEPFYMQELEDFDIAYLSGFYADHYDVSAQATQKRAEQRSKALIKDAILRECPMDEAPLNLQFGEMGTYEFLEDEDEYTLQDIKYAFLPAYFVNLEYKQGRQLVIVNGQTGKVVGNLPLEKEQFIRKFAKNAVISCTIFSLLSILFFYVPALIPAFIIPLAVVIWMLYSGIRSYNLYKLGMLQMSSHLMQTYSNREED